MVISIDDVDHLIAKYMMKNFLLIPSEIIMTHESARVLKNKGYLKFDQTGHLRYENFYIYNLSDMKEGDAIARSSCGQLQQSLHDNVSICKKGTGNLYYFS